ncbi:MAG: hypothetical protein JO253_02970 [Alphaproteobacteria bacterium]|nr:hypothetical protein [Alphaproteobacteria bacterium]
MPKLYVANCTKQDHHFLFRVPEINRESPFHMKIGVGKCEQIYKEDSTDVLDAIIRQHTDYGLVRVDEVDRTKEFIGMCYQIDKPINVDAIVRAINHNDEVLAQRGVELRKETAVAISEQAAREAREVGGALTSMEVSIEEVVENGDTAKINESVEVVAEGQAPRSRRAQK